MKKTILTTLLALSLSPSAFAEPVKPTNRADLVPNIPACQVTTYDRSYTTVWFSIKESYPNYLTFQPPAPFNDTVLEFETNALSERKYFVQIVAKVDGVNVNRAVILTKDKYVTRMQGELFIQRDDTDLTIRCFWASDYTKQHSK